MREPSSPNSLHLHLSGFPEESPPEGPGLCGCCGACCAPPCCAATRSLCRDGEVGDSSAELVGLELRFEFSLAMLPAKPTKCQAIFLDYKDLWSS